MSWHYGHVSSYLRVFLVSSLCTKTYEGRYTLLLFQLPCKHGHGSYLVLEVKRSENGTFLQRADDKEEFESCPTTNLTHTTNKQARACLSVGEGVRNYYRRQSQEICVNAPFMNQPHLSPMHRCFCCWSIVEIQATDFWELCDVPWKFSFLV